jgi:hypothetical protein
MSSVNGYGSLTNDLCCNRFSTSPALIQVALDVLLILGGVYLFQAGAGLTSYRFHLNPSVAYLVRFAGGTICGIGVGLLLEKTLNFLERKIIPNCSINPTVAYIAFTALYIAAGAFLLLSAEGLTSFAIGSLTWRVVAYATGAALALTGVRKLIAVAKQP